ncbi:MAG: putative redox protein [Chloroflexota bacterium]|nr:putative redox protein [Chloroflexota bacterium]
MPTLKSVEIEHRGGMLFEARPSSGHTLRFDDRESNQGGSPVETVLAALGSCSAMDVISIAAKKRQAVEQYRIHVRGSQRDEYPQILTEVDVTHEVVGRDLVEAAIRRAIELSATKYCPVNAMVSAGATVVHHRYRIVSSGEEPYESEGEVIATGPYARPDVV